LACPWFLIIDLIASVSPRFEAGLEKIESQAPEAVVIGRGSKAKRPAWKTTPAALRGILGATASTDFGPMLGSCFAEYRFTEYE
jgi:hypothetical protein